MTCSYLDLSDEHTAGLVLGLQRLAYRVEADLIGRDDLPPLHETLTQLQRSEETFIGLWRSAVLIGVVAFRRAGTVVDLHRVMVHPAYFRQGVARTLVLTVLAEHHDVTRVVVSTGRDNQPARRLYERLGFTHLNDREVVPGLFIAEYVLERA